METNPMQNNVRSQLWQETVRLMLNPAELAEVAEKPGSRLLLMDGDAERRETRLALLAPLHSRVHTAANFLDVSSLPASTSYGLILLSVIENRIEMHRIAAYARRCWPDAKILLLGESAHSMEDYLYDELMKPDEEAA